MPRRQVKEVPRWRRGQQARTKQQEKDALARAVAAHLAKQAATPAVPGVNSMLGKTGTYRFRRHLPPFLWLGWVLAWGLGAGARDNVKLALVVAAVTAGGIWLLTRHLPDFTRKCSYAMAAGAALWIPALSLTGFAPPWPHLLVGLYRALVLGSMLAVTAVWVRHYRFRPAEPEAAAPSLPMGDVAIWTRLAAKNRWEGHLSSHKELPDGGRQWHIVLNGAETHIGQVMSEPRKIAAAWGKSITEAYAEPSPDGIESSGRLTILPKNTLEQSRQWDRSPIDHETGIAVIGWFPDGKPAHERYFIRRNGIRHTIVGGADGSGKTGLLDLGLCLSATSGIITPVILDPQEGQALPAWREHVPYASGVNECMAYLYGLQLAMLDRSRYLAGLTWEAPDGSPRKGFGFFDPFMTGLPIVEITLDEAPALLADPKWGAEAVLLLGAIGKMGRKVGFRLRLGVQVPSLAELGGSQALRSMLVGGNVFCGRAGDKVTGGMIGISADPSVLPKYFPDGKPTVGLGYTSGPDNRPSTPMRWKWVEDPYAVAASANIRPMDDRCAAAMADGIAGRPVATPLPAAGPAPLAAVPPPPDEEPAPPGRSASDAILAVLDEAGGEVDRGEIVKRAGALVTSQWGRAKPFSVKAMQNALTALEASRQIAKPRHGTYAPIRTTIHAVSRNDHETTEATGA